MTESKTESIRKVLTKDLNGNDVVRYIDANGFYRSKRAYEKFGVHKKEPIYSKTNIGNPMEGYAWKDKYPTLEYMKPKEFEGTEYGKSYDIAVETGNMTPSIFNGLIQGFKSQFGSTSESSEDNTATTPKDVVIDNKGTNATTLNIVDENLKKEVVADEFSADPEVTELGFNDDEAEYDEDLGFKLPSEYKSKRKQIRAMKKLGWSKDDINTYYKNKEKIDEISEDNELSIYDKARNISKRSALASTAPQLFGMASNISDLVENSGKDFEPLVYEESGVLSRIEAPNIYDPAKRQIEKNTGTTIRQLRETGNSEYITGVGANAISADLDAKVKQAALDTDARNKTISINAQERAQKDSRKFQAELTNDANYRQWLREKQTMDALGKNAIYKGAVSLSDTYNSYLANKLSVDMQEDVANKNAELQESQQTFLQE